MEGLAVPGASAVAGFDRCLAGTPFGPGPVIHADIIIADKAKPQCQYAGRHTRTTAGNHTLLAINAGSGKALPQVRFCQKPAIIIQQLVKRQVF